MQLLALQLEQANLIPLLPLAGHRPLLVRTCSCIQSATTNLIVLIIEAKPNLFRKEPEKYDLQSLLCNSLQMSPKWFDIGNNLRVEDGFLESLRKTGDARTDEEKLGEVLVEWIDSQCSDVTWQTIIDVMVNLRKKKQAQQLKQYLEQPEVIERYRGKKDFEGFCQT